LPWGRAWEHPYDPNRRWFARKPTFGEYLSNIRGFDQQQSFSPSGQDLTRQFDSLSIDGEIAVDDAGRFENLPGEFGRICELAGISARPPPHRLKSRRVKHFTAYCGRQQREFVAAEYARDMDALGFRFERETRRPG
jgi:hypothetical protein